MAKTSATINVALTEEANRILDAHEALLEQMKRITGALIILQVNNATVEHISHYGTPFVRVRFPAWGGDFVERSSLVEAAEAAAAHEGYGQGDEDGR